MWSRLFSAVLLAALLSCAQPMELETAPVAIEEPETIQEPDPIPVWQPEDNTVYVFEGETIIYDLYCPTYETFYQTAKSARTMAQLHNRDYATTWRVACGTCTWEAA